MTTITTAAATATTRRLKSILIQRLLPEGPDAQALKGTVSPKPSNPKHSCVAGCRNKTFETLAEVMKSAPLQPELQVTTSHDMTLLMNLGAGSNASAKPSRKR